MTYQLAEDEPDLQCPYCSAYYTNEFALAIHVKQCQARVGKTELEEPNDYPESPL